MRAEYEALVATYTEFEDCVVEEKNKKAREYFQILPDRTMSLGFGRRPGKSQTEIERTARMASQLRPRILFQAKHYKHPTFGDLYGFYMSDYQNTSLLSYNCCFYIAPIDDSLKIISKYVADPASENVSWEYLCGIELETLGELVELLKFTAPERCADLADYDAE
ncbi:MAG: hypothetical protein F6K18_25595 [Okeania sp. SIO2C2]|uniref:hypothetical protein n=1 Tax=Okeania sp. SIO2C2 TaxID=2607787 RepID=UPI0013BE67AA|nr:hypothetical protein [Okeania sp. SIO2C2]NEP89924.1 hypothetical protein [Okeania sp. SIO2C2]